MRKFLPYLQTITIFLAVATLFLAPSPVHAQGFGCITSVAGFIDCAYGALGQFLWEIVIPIVQSVLSAIGLLIDTAITLSLTSSFYASDAITSGWAIIRDLCNIIFIFVLIFTGIRTILGLDTGETRRIVVSVIIGAVLINFSLFLTKAAIDVSNIFTAWITQGIVDLSGGTGGVSNSTVSVLKMSELYKTQTTGNLQIGAFSTAFAVIALNMVAIYVFFKVAFLMFGRLVSFITLLIMSPIGFVGHLVPKLDSYAKQWRDELTKACLMAPMFLLMLYITLYLATKFDVVLSEMGQKLSLNSTNTFFSGNSFGLDDYTLFIIIALLLLKSLEVAEEYTGAVAGQIGGVIKSAAGIALGGVTAGAGLAGRQIIGRGALAYTQNKEAMSALQGRAANGGLGGVVARMQLAATNKAATSSFDARATKLGGAALGAMDPNLSLAGIKLDASKVGKTQSGGFKAQVEEIAKTEKEYAEKNLGKGKAGEANRLKYANTVSNSLWYVGRRAGAKKAGEEISDEAYKAYVKAETAGAQGDAQKIKNQMIDEQVAIENLKNASKTNNVSDINTSLKKEKDRIENTEKKFRENKDNKLAYNRYEREKQEALSHAMDPGIATEAKAKMVALDNEFTEATKNMTVAEKEKLENAEKGKIKEVKDFEKFIESHKKNLDNALVESDLAKKRQMVDSVNDFIQKERVGKPGTWNKDNQKFEGGSGLSEMLREKKKEIQDKKREQDILEGKTPKGKDKNTPPPPDEEPEEDDKK